MPRKKKEETTEAAVEAAPKSKTAPAYTYARQPQTPEQAARIPEILAHWHDMEDLRPLPLEWLVESLKAGRILDPPEDY